MGPIVAPVNTSPTSTPGFVPSAATTSRRPVGVWFLRNAHIGQKPK